MNRKDIREMRVMCASKVANVTEYVIKNGEKVIVGKWKLPYCFETTLPLTKK